LTIVHEDRWLVVIDKPAGLVVHPRPGHEAGTLVNALLAHVRDLRGIGGELRPGIVHRIDKDTSGLLVVAKDDRTMAALAAAFKAHTVEARVRRAGGGQAARAGRPHRHAVRPRSEGAQEVLQPRAARASARSPTGAWSSGSRARRGIEARLETGRTHQVRVHLAALGCPLLADRTYGRQRATPRCAPLPEALGRQALHARTLAFVHPATGKKLSFASELPADMQAALTALRALPTAKGSI
jgi:23S rRNA pseudouridine1911/1915/1917 synthase